MTEFTDYPKSSAVQFNEINSICVKILKIVQILNNSGTNLDNALFIRSLLEALKCIIIILYNFDKNKKKYQNLLRI